MDLRVEVNRIIYTRLSKQNIGGSTISKIHYVLRRWPNLVVESGLIIRNPVEFTHPLKKPISEMKIFDQG